MSNREPERYIAGNNSGKWFCDFTLTEKTPDHTVFNRIKKRLGTNLLSKIVAKLRNQVRSAGYMSEVFTFVDATHLISKSRLWEERNMRQEDESLRS